MGNDYAGPGLSGTLIITHRGDAGTIQIQNGLVRDADKKTRRIFKGIIGDHIGSFISFAQANDWHCTFIPTLDDSMTSKYKNPKKRKEK